MDRGGPRKVVVVDDDPSSLALVEAGLANDGVDVRMFEEPAAALEHVSLHDADVVLTDLNMGKTSGLDVCRQLATSHPDVPVIVVTAFGSLDAAVSAIRAGAYDFITKPIDMDVLKYAVTRAFDHRDVTRQLDRAVVIRRESGSDRLGPMARVDDLVERVAPSDATVLVTGESGTGKELVARAIHAASKRAGRFVPINCAAMPANLLESELFGHVAGAFTDAKNSRDGLLVEARGGTLFLDEIGEMPLEMQVKLLRVLQERKVRPVGGSEETSVDCRVVAATHRDLEAMVEQDRFREDLFYRINVVQIDVPPLRDRSSELLELALGFMEEFSTQDARPLRGISKDAVRLLLAYDWPGNVRELRNCMQRAVALTRHDQILPEDLPEKIRGFEAESDDVDDADPERMPSMDTLERQYIRKVLRAVDGNKTRAAQVLGLDRRTLYRKLERFEEEGVS